MDTRCLKILTKYKSEEDTFVMLRKNNKEHKAFFKDNLFYLKRYYEIHFKRLSKNAYFYHAHDFLALI